ncbi:ECF RNA polymerase sigma factor SigL [Planctomycetes bacterium Poly30]|uniref:ECF RNA polymerase sigma factor SigL n=1 Tax=Saltatorellus ferox TaxID=2528018 RepID=A0A518F052_9BACT|nr:ECF RNA polymerase sigma factor SigL [Planctomycetes bacterium Poly30]
MSHPDFLLAELSQHETFVRRTLTATLRNHAEVDDVIQETWIRTLAHGTVPGRAWLARTARNVAASRWRSDERRRFREQAREQELEAPSTDASLQRVEDRQKVVRCILGLAEPYRGVVLMRYEENLSVAEIASALDRSPGTVRSQLSRAHELLRTRLDADFGDRKHWAALALPAAMVKKSAAASVGVIPFAVAAGIIAAAGLGLLAYRVLQPATDPPAPLVSNATIATLSPGETRLSAPLLTPPSSESRTEAAAPLQEAATPKNARPYEERLMPRAELLARSYFGNYEKATFSFPFGIRDDPGLELTRNSWSVLFGNGRGRLDFGMTRYGSFVVDLGRVDPQSAADLTITSLAFDEDSVVPRVGHSYFVISRDEESTLASLVHVVEHEPKRRCVFDWYSTDGTGRAQGSIVDDREGRPLVDALKHWYSLLGAGTELATPEVLLQLRAGAGGGNPNTIDMTGNVSTYVDKLVPTPLDFFAEIEMKDPSLAYFHGGIVGSNRAFVVTSIDYEGVAKGDSNGHGEFQLVVGGTKIASYRDRDEPFRDRWNGRLVIESGDESSTYLEVANSSSGKVSLRGHFEERVPLEDAPFSPAGKGFLGDHAIPESPVIPELQAPRVLLQARNGRGGGNGHEINMCGTASYRFDSISKTPLDVVAPLDDRTRSIAFAEGGAVPAGQQFVVTSARMRGFIVGEQSYRYARLYLGQDKLIDVKSPAPTVDETWNGSIVILPGEETRLFLEIADCASIEVVLEGRFEPIR